MSQSLKLFAMAGLIVAVAACARNDSQPEEFVVVDPEPISVEPVYTGKFK
ncbi:MAG: hypothetical protein MK098_00490 [Marinovum sp.]|nr:hypothetical protein [Marinovum sp.]